MRYGVVLGRGRYPDEIAGFSAQEGPRLEFVAIAQALCADVLSYTSAAARRGALFRAAFDRRPEWGSAVDAFSRIDNYDRFYCTGEDVSLRIGLLLALRPREKRIVTLVHNLTPKKAAVLRRIGHRSFAAFVILGETQRAALIGAGVPPSKIVLLHNWVDDRYFVPQDGPVDDLLVACGAENRDYATLRAAAETSGRQVRVFGHGFFGRSGAAGAVGGSAHFHLMERVSFKELRQAYANACAVVVPLNDVEYAAGVTGLVEAYAMGKAVIASDSRGLRTYLAHGPGILVPTGDVRALAKALSAVDSLDLAALGANNRRWVVEHCALDTYVASIVHMMRTGMASTSDQMNEATVRAAPSRMSLDKVL
jgi:glycosyltransferase involved in cell wall biosynthesis